MAEALGRASWRAVRHAFYSRRGERGADA